MSYLVEQLPHCDLLRLSLSTGWFVLSARQVVRARLSSFFPLVGHRSPTSTCVLENTPVPDKYLNKIFSGSPQQVVAASRQTDFKRVVFSRLWMFWALVSTQHLQARYLRDLSLERDMLRGNRFRPIFLPKSKLTPVRPYFKRVVFGRFWISRALVSTKHLQASYLMDFSTENGMLRGNKFFPFFSPKSKLTPVRPYFKRVVFGRFQIFWPPISTKH